MNSIVAQGHCFKIISWTQVGKKIKAKILLEEFKTFSKWCKLQPHRSKNVTKIWTQYEENYAKTQCNWIPQNTWKGKFLKAGRGKKKCYFSGTNIKITYFSLDTMQVRKQSIKNLSKKKNSETYNSTSRKSASQKWKQKGFQTYKSWKNPSLADLHYKKV